MRTYLVFAATLVMMAAASPVVIAQIALPYGTGPGQVAFLNAKIQPDAEELHPLGPQSFRCTTGGFWIADSVAGRLLCLDQAGKILANLPVASGPGGLIEDLALSFSPAGDVSAIYLLDGHTQQILEVAPDGTQRRALGGSGDAAGSFLQAELIEVNAAGQIFVADRARQSLTVFAPTGAVLRDLHWEWSGFCLDPAGNLCRLHWDETAAVTHLIVETPEGKLIRDVVLDIGEHTDPRVWRVNADGEALVSWVPATGFNGAFKIASFAVTGKPLVTGVLTPPVAMNRFLDQTPDGKLIHAVANYEDAPDSSFRLEPFTLK